MRGPAYLIVAEQYVRTEEHNSFGERSLFVRHRPRQSPPPPAGPCYGHGQSLQTTPQRAATDDQIPAVAPTSNGRAPQAGQQQEQVDEDAAASSRLTVIEGSGALAQDRRALRHLGALATQLLKDKTPVHERMALLRTAADSSSIMLRDGEIMAITANARRDLQGRAGAATPDDEFDISETAWAWDQVVATGGLNLLVALQKVGKTALIAGVISAWHYGAEEFLGLKLTGPCPPVIIAGTDQTITDWKNVLAPAGLMEKTPSGKWKFCGPIKKVWHRSRPVFLDMAGVEDIAQACEQFPGALLICDTYAALVAPMGLDEAKPEAAEPLYNLLEMVEPHGATIVLLHHASKSRAHERASNASRNSNALPAAATQCINLHWVLPDSKSDQRINLTTEGRNGRPVDLVIEQVDRSQWICHGSGEEIKEQQRREEAETNLNDRQDAALEHVRQLWSQGIEATAPLLQDWQPVVFDDVRKARKTLQQLHAKGLLEKRNDIDPMAAGTVIRYRPAGADMAVLTRGDVQKGGPQGPQSPQPPIASQPWEVGPQSPQISRGNPGDPEDSPDGPPRTREDIGSGADAFDDEDDPHWPKRRDTACPPPPATPPASQTPRSP